MKKSAELKSGLDNLQEKLDDVIRCAEDLHECSKKFRCFGGQLDGYFIGAMKNFVDNNNQPGSIETLRNMLAMDEEGYDDDENYNGDYENED